MALGAAVEANPLSGFLGIAQQMRWATHGEPSQLNAHPHMSGDRLAIVHNGIIENYQELREELKATALSLLPRPIPKSLYI